ncbi:DUF4843 domain-containing protein [Flavobacteriaceae bacterium]|nr:DUF4843 domain-containing protein [Flavobacteriaceae bacterium]
MKQFFFLIGFLVVILFSCNTENEFKEFDLETRYIYFDQEKVLLSNNQPTGKRVDSIRYSFSEEPLEVTEKLFAVPLAISGVAADTDKKYKVEIIEEETSLTDEEWDRSTIENNVFKKGHTADTLWINIKRTESLKTNYKRLTLRLLSTDDLPVGREDCLKIKLVFSDMLVEPIWWKSWERVMGPFYLATYYKWKEIYYFGCDINKVSLYGDVSKDRELPFYWDNMPVGSYVAYEHSQPSTFMYLRKLYDYFNENEVYAIGQDGSKVRIKIFIND